MPQPPHPKFPLPVRYPYALIFDPFKQILARNSYIYVRGAAPRNFPRLEIAEVTYLFAQALSERIPVLYGFPEQGANARPVARSIGENKKRPVLERAQRVFTATEIAGAAPLATFALVPPTTASEWYQLLAREFP